MPDLKQRIRIIFWKVNIIYSYTGFAAISYLYEDYGI